MTEKTQRPLVVVAGASGMLSQAIVAALATTQQWQVVALSRHQPKNLPATVKWLRADMSDLTDKKWQKAVKEAKWVINCIGILRPTKQQTFANSSVAPALNLARVVQSTATNVLFISANYFPKTANGKQYMAAKMTVEQKSRALLGQRFYCLYPGLVMSKQRPRSLVEGSAAAVVAWCFRQKRLQPTSLAAVVAAVTANLAGQTTPLNHRRR